MNLVPEDVREAAARIRALVLDVDGVLTDGQLRYGPNGEEVKAFSVRDGLGIRMLLEGGIAVAIITARSSAALTRRAQDLGIEHVLSGRRDKSAALSELCGTLGLEPGAVAFAGDDLLDVPVLNVVGLPISVADGHWSAKQAARWVTELGGGRGAVREITDGLLEARGALVAAQERVLGGTDR